MSDMPNAPTAAEQVTVPLSADEQRQVVEWAREKVALRRDDFPHWLAEQVLKFDAALLAAREDTARLDWLEFRRAAIRCEDPQLGYREPWSVTDYSGGMMKWVRGDGSTLRAAIDAARAAPGTP